MKRVDFYTLPRAVQDHVVDSLAGRLVPVPILARYGARPVALYWWVLSCIAAIATLLLCVIGYGNASSALSLHPLPVVAVYVLLVAAFGAGLINAAAYRARIKALPFAPGVYLFPANVIDARGSSLRVFPLEQLTSAGGGGGGVVLVFGSEKFGLPLADVKRLPEALARIEEAKQRAANETDPRVRFELDALEPPSVMSPLAPQHPLLFAAPIWLRLRWVIALVVGVLIGGGIYQVRNSASDNSMLAKARLKNDVASYRAYVERGKRHHDMVANVLLPRAELAVAVADGSVEAIDAFIAAHPKTGIQAEVAAARRAALAAEFERAKAKGTASALLTFAARYPKHELGAAYDQARHAIYVRARTRFQATLPDGEEKTAELVKKLLAYSEKEGAKLVGGSYRGPAVQIRFARLEPVSMGRADSAVSKNPSFNGVTSYPSRYFDDKRLTPFEKDLSQKLAERLGRAFEPEILVFEAGPAIEWTDDGPAAVKVPTIAVSYRVEWSGGAFAKTKPRAVVIGLFVFFRSSFAMPGEEAVQLVKFTAAENVPHDVIDAIPAGKPAGTLESAAYEAMTRDAFGQFEQRYLAKWFK